MCEKDRERLLNIKTERIDFTISIIGFISVILCLVVLMGSSWLAENVFSYEIPERKTKRVAYQVAGEPIQTFVCYTTNYGECYHASGCGSLWNSSHKTTVYEATRSGYIPCSKCEPTERTELATTKTLYRDEEYTVWVKKYPKNRVAAIGCAFVVVLYSLIITPLYLYKRRVRSLQTPLFYSSIKSIRL